MLITKTSCAIVHLVAFLLVRRVLTFDYNTAAFPCDSTCYDTQRRGLMALYDATQVQQNCLVLGDNSLAQTVASGALPLIQGGSWTTSTYWGSTVDHCSWFGVLCCGSSGTLQTVPQPALSSCLSPGAVLAVAIPGNNLRGTLPEAFFSSLRSLVNVDVRGKLQSMVPRVSRICVVFFLVHYLLLPCVGNGLTGPIPTSIAQANLRFLNGLFLDKNSLTGTIPASIFGFTSLVTLRLVCTT